MDVMRTLLCIGLFALLVNFRFRGLQPVREFVSWGLLYPFHFCLMTLLILVIWGVIGTDYGLQGLFLEDNVLTQMILGVVVMLLFAALILHYSVFDSPRRWMSTLKGLVEVLRILGGTPSAGPPLQLLLRNGFLERFDRSDLKAIDESIAADTDLRRVTDRSDEPHHAGLEGVLNHEAFRLLMSPAVLLVKGFVLVFLVGIVPAIVIPALNRQPDDFVERLPWLFGVFLGDILGILVACQTTRWAADAAGWGPFEERALEVIRASAAKRPSESGGPIDNRNEASLRSEAAAPTPLREPSVKTSSEPREAKRTWVQFLLAFFIIHFLVNVVPPESFTSRWIDWPERTYLLIPTDNVPPPSVPNRWASLPWLPIGVLLAEAAGAMLMLHALGVLRRSRIWQDWTVLWSRVSAVLASAARDTLVFLSHRHRRRTVITCLVVGTAVAIIAPRLVSPAQVRSLWDGLWGITLLGTFFSIWLVAFWMATRPISPAVDGKSAPPIVVSFSLAFLVLLYLGGASHRLIGLLALVAVTSGIAQVLRPAVETGGTAVWTRRAAATTLIIAWIGSFLSGWGRSDAAIVTAAWLGLAFLVLGSVAMAGVGRSRPTLLYPLTLIVAFVAFAIPYTALDEPWQAAIPAGGSVACLVGLVASVYTIIAFFRPRSALLAGAVVVTAVLLVNGNAWFVAPNEFKSTFPNMESYYRLPIYLDSKDYFRATTPTTVRLRNPDVTGDFDRMEKQNKSERLATAFFRPPEQRTGRDGSYGLRLRIEDPRGRLRAVPGDEVRLAAQEWYTTEVDGDDCLVLAEEGLNRKIYRWLSYSKLLTVRDGIIRGAEHLLVPESEAAAAFRNVDALLKPRITAYRPVTGPGNLRGLRLLGLAADYRKTQAQYVLISMYWSGRVLSVEHASHLDKYEVEFTIPPGGEPLDASELKVMSGWLERCHLDAVRPAVTLKPERVPDTTERTPIPLPAARPGECLVLEDGQAEAPIPVGIYLATGGSGQPAAFPAFARYWPTQENLARAVNEFIPAALPPGATPSPAHSRGFTIRRAHDRGLFASPAPFLTNPPAAATQAQGPKNRVAMYNAGRLRPGDRLILCWRRLGDPPIGQGHRESGIFMVQALGERTGPEVGDRQLPPGYEWMTLIRVAHSGELPGAGHPPKLDGFPKLLVGEWQALQPLNNTEVLIAWKRLVGSRWQGDKPKLVIVTVSGGGIRASVWTSVVLRKLEQTLGAEFPYHVRLITGASGGMVGGAYYAASLSRPSEHLFGENASFTARHGVNIEEFVERMATDQLDSVAGRLVFADMLSALNPFLQDGDRGKTLEETWIRWTGGRESSPLARALQSYAADERLGWRPSLAFTPMMVEDGRRLLISNLDLAFATRNVGGLLIEPSSRKIERPVYQGEDLDTSIHDEDDVFSLSAVEFFRLFPEAHNFRVTTAVRMSASFPWVSPAISLPTLPPRRVVDAGYYDNYGVNLAALWSSKMRSWLEANTSGVVVVQIRDHVSQGARTEIDFDRLTGSSALDRLTWHAGRDLLTPGLQAISTPILGMSNARQWTMSFRNDEQVDLLDLLFDDERGRDFFRTVVFECPVEVSLNWTLQQAERETLMSGFGRPGSTPRAELSLIKDYTTGRDSYELHKWTLEHRNDPTFQAQLKEKYDAQLRILGLQGTRRLTLRQSQQHYENLVQNLKRLELLRNWWLEGQRPLVTQPR